MKLTSRTIFIISGDPVIGQGCIEELAAFGGRYRTPVVGTVEQARKRIGRSAPAAVFLDESAIDIAHGGETLESAVALLTEAAPVIVAAAPEKQTGLAFLITSGAVDFVARTSHFLPIVAGMLDRRVRMAERATGMIQFPKDDLSGDFGEILRHEVNNPLTGILGNTELLLARRDRLPPSAVERLETIAELAVRLRETLAASPMPGTSITSMQDQRKKRGQVLGGRGQGNVRDKQFVPPCFLPPAAYHPSPFTSHLLFRS